MSRADLPEIKKQPSNNIPRQQRTAATPHNRLSATYHTAQDDTNAESSRQVIHMSLKQLTRVTNLNRAPARVVLAKVQRPL
jgi:hypothetical protein